MRSITITSLLVFAVSVLFVNVVFAEDDPLNEPFLDGDVWVVSSEAEKIAYVLGAADFLTMEYVSQMKFADPTPATEQTTVQSFWVGLEGATMNSIVDTVDEWYAANPASLDKPVLVVIWNEIVEQKIDD